MYYLLLFFSYNASCMTSICLSPLSCYTPTPVVNTEVYAKPHQHDQMNTESTDGRHDGEQLTHHIKTGSDVLPPTNSDLLIIQPVAVAKSKTSPSQVEDSSILRVTSESNEDFVCDQPVSQVQTASQLRLSALQKHQIALNW